MNPLKQMANESKLYLNFMPPGEKNPMLNLRFHGTSPFTVTVLHGGPGAPGEMAPVARHLAPRFGVIEPMQLETSIDGQIQELLAVLKKFSKIPATFIGHSWGAWLGYIFAARYPKMVKKLILVGCGPFEEKYVPFMNETRSSRMSDADNARVLEILEVLAVAGPENRDALFGELGRMMEKADSYCPLPAENEKVTVQADVFQKIMTEVLSLRQSGELLDIARSIECPVVAIHGDFDPHPYQGVEEPLSGLIRDFRLYLLEKCGHSPWKERYARNRFFEILTREIK